MKMDINFEKQVSQGNGGYPIPIGIMKGKIKLYDPTPEEMEGLGLKPAMLGTDDSLKLLFELEVEGKTYYEVCKIDMDKKYDHYKSDDKYYVFVSDQHGNVTPICVGEGFEELSFEQQTAKLKSILKDEETIKELIDEAQAPRKASGGYVPSDWKYDQVKPVKSGEIELRHLVVAALGLVAKSQIIVDERMFDHDYCYTFDVGNKKTNLKNLLEGKVVYCICTVSMSNNKFYPKISPGNKYLRGFYNGSSTSSNNYFTSWVSKVMKNDTPISEAKKNSIVLFGSDKPRIIKSNEILGDNEVVNGTVNDDSDSLLDKLLPF